MVYHRNSGKNVSYVERRQATPAQINTITAVIGGSGLAKLSGLEIKERQVIRTPYGEPSSPMLSGFLEGEPVLFLARHGHGHTIPPHQVNYRANIWALKHLGIQNIVAVGAVGAINTGFTNGLLIIPDQLIDYTYSRLHTFYDGESKRVNHVDFTNPYTPKLRELIVSHGLENDMALIDRATYAVVQGPRLETAAEIRRFKNDGADLVGMTSMPEAGLAREMGINYALIALVVNSAAGLESTQLDEKGIFATIEKHKHKVIELISCSLPFINQLN